MDQKPRYRRGVGMIILNSKKQIFIGQRFDKDKSAWQMPQGGIDKGESPAKAVIREMKEETGIKKIIKLYMNVKLGIFINFLLI